MVTRKLTNNELDEDIIDIAPQFVYRPRSVANDYYQLAILEKKPDGLVSFTILIDSNENALYPIEALEPIKKALKSERISEESLCGSNFHLTITLDKPLTNWSIYLNSLLSRISTSRSFLYENYLRHL